MTQSAPEQLQQLLDILDRMVPVPPEAPKAPEVAWVDGLVMKYKTVDEIWDNATYGYMVVDSFESTPKEKDPVDYVFIVRRRFDKTNTEHEYFVDIKAEGLRDSLREVLRGVKGVSLREDKPIVSPKLLFHYLDRFEKDLASPDGASSHTQQLEILVEFLRGHYASAIESRQALLKHGQIRFDLLWTIFPPNIIVYTERYEHNLPRYLRLEWSGEMQVQGRKVFTLDCRYLGYDGESLGDVSISLVIQEFRGEEKIESIDVFPLNNHAKAKEVRMNLITLGQTFISLRGMHHLEHDGFAFIRKDGNVHTMYMKGRVMIDAGSFKRNHPNNDIPKVRVDPFGTHTIMENPERDLNRITRRIGPDDMKEESLLTCSPTVFGFSFKSKGWVPEFAISSLQKIHWDLNPFQSLVLPDGRKEIIQALIKAHISERADQSFDDIVKGKGQGLIFLFHGSPGVGKTLTAEATSEFLNRPLYTVSADDVGTCGYGLDARLSATFDLADRWNAILLIDEADIFLEKRSSQSLERNGLVSVFLRNLKYFQGILVLTTNRIETFDDAVQSRINLPLKFKDLDEPAKTKIWTTFLKLSCKARGVGDVTNVISLGQLEDLAKKELNGRELAGIEEHLNSSSQNVTLSKLHLTVEDYPPLSSPSNSLPIGSKGKAPFLHLEEFSGIVNPMSASGPHTPSGSTGTSTESDDNALGTTLTPRGNATIASRHSFCCGGAIPEGDTGNEETTRSRQLSDSDSSDEDEVMTIHYPRERTDVRDFNLQHPLERNMESGGCPQVQIVDEFWNQNTNKYEVTAPEDGSVEHPFIIHRMLGNPGTGPKCNVDIRSKGLRNIILWALENTSDPLHTEAIPRTPRRDDLTVDLDILLKCFTRLEENLEHLGRLVRFLTPFREIDVLLEIHKEVCCPLLSVDEAKDGQVPPNSPSHTPDSEPAETNRQLHETTDMSCYLGGIRGGFH
ncbi:MAG: hypothetical protein M1840_002662 [Geoglossum simile]|nr:MAG: hypothetical protein M1840_002662 [Geoglossum simile]